MLQIPGTLRRWYEPVLRAGAMHAVWRDFPLADLTELLGGQPVLVVAPHPDDETLGCGGLIAECCARGNSVHVLILTDGTGSHTKSREYPRQRLAALREDETRQAVATLGLPEDRLTFFGLQDGHAPLRGSKLRATAGRIAEHARERAIGTICTTWWYDPHRDHRAAYRLARLAAGQLGTKLLCYPVWGWMVPPAVLLPARSMRGVRLDIGRHLAAKRRAIDCHVSQTTDLIRDDPSGFRLSAEFLDIFNWPFEVFITGKTSAKQHQRSD